MKDALGSPKLNIEVPVDVGRPCPLPGFLVECPAHYLQLRRLDSTRVFGREPVKLGHEQLLHQAVHVAGPTRVI